MSRPVNNQMRLGLLISNLTDRKVLETWTWPYGPFMTPPATGGREFSVRVGYNY